MRTNGDDICKGFAKYKMLIPLKSVTVVKSMPLACILAL